MILTILMACPSSSRWQLFRGKNPKYETPGLDDDEDIGAVLSPGAIILEHLFTGEANRWSNVRSTALMTVGLGGVEQWSLRVGRGLIDARRLVDLSVGLMTSMTYRNDKIYAVIPPEDETAEDDDDGS